MTDVGLVVSVSMLASAGGWLVASALAQPRPSLRTAVRRLDRTPLGELDADHDRRGRAGAVRQVVAAALLSDTALTRRWLPTDVQLRLVGRSPVQHVAYVVSAAIVGFVLPASVVAIAQALGLIGLRWFAAVIVGLLVSVVGVMLVHTATGERATAVRADLRHQLSAYLDVVSMLLAGNSGYEGALENAAHAGDGRLFVELRRAMRDAGARGRSLTEALQSTGSALGLDELEQIASAAAVSAAEGAPVVRTLTAKCATLRNALASEHEAEARLRTSRLTTPMVGMALIFMALVMFPALSFS